MKCQAWAVILMLLLVSTVFAQQRGGTPATRTPNQPATPTVAPRNADGRPDLNGIWQALDGPNWNIEAHGYQSQ